MDIEIIERIPYNILIDRIRTVPLMKPSSDGSAIYVYQNADISTQRSRFDQVNPPTFYLLEEQMQVQRDLREALLEQENIDLLHLPYGVRFRDGDGNEHTLTPPIVEFTPRTIRYMQQPGELNHSQRLTEIMIPVIGDGAHRVALSRELGTDFTGIFISNVDPNYPYYAHPNNWNDVRLVQDVPRTKGEKKMYSLEDCYGLYRDFGVLGCGKPRYLGGT